MQRTKFYPLTDVENSSIFYLEQNFAIGKQIDWT